MHHAHVNVSMIAENVIEIKSGITINVGVNVKIQQKIMCGKEIIFGILPHVLVNMVNMQEIYYSVITCDEIIYAIAKSYDEETKTVPTKRTSTKTVPKNFNEQKAACKTKKLPFYQLP